MPRKTDAEKAQKRLSTCPAEMWDLLQAAIKSEPKTMHFATHRETCAFISRYNHFRMDAIEADVAGALMLRSFSVSGQAADGTLFHTTRRDAPGPFSMTWRNAYASAPEVRGSLSVEEVASATLLKRELNQELAFGEDEHDAKLREIMGLGPARTSAVVVSSDTPAQGAVMPQADTHVHEWDATEVFCLVCREPKP